MLTELRIDNFAIIQHLELNFENGLTTFTGETGAGKSIILDAILALVGGRVDASMIRSGVDRAMVEGTFRFPPASAEQLRAVLQREELLDDPDYLTMSRELRREGRSAARINGRMVNVSLLSELGSYLVDIHGQSEHLSLLNPRAHLGLLDRFANCADQVDAYRQVYRRLQTLRRELGELRRDEQEAARRSELLTFQLQEIESAQLKPGEEDDIRQERDRLANAEALSLAAQESLILLDEGVEEAPCISDQMGQVVKSLSALARLDPSRAMLYEQAESASEILNELARSLRDYVEVIEFNPRRLEQVEDRLEVILRIKRKYGGAVEAALAFAAETSAKLEAIAHATERIGELEANEAILLEQLARCGQDMAAQRHRAADELAASVDRELGDLNMDGAHFKVDFAHQADPKGLPLEDGTRVTFDENGLERVEFLLAPNLGEGFKPLVKVASGGETSRIMLALKNVLAGADDIPTLIFDEIDQGIGGRTGVVVGEKLWQLARRHQVFCVTHLPQLAAFGDQHYGVRKLVQDGRTLTDVRELNDAARLDELAQMLGGLNEANRDAARQALDMARRRAALLIKK